jgi:membrane associated rhomboid family serine protease
VTAPFGATDFATGLEGGRKPSLFLFGRALRVVLQAAYLSAAHRIRSLQREPIFNVPAVIVALIAAFALIHVVRTWFLSEQQDIDVLLLFAFIPARYDASLLVNGGLPGGVGAQVWTFVTYAFLHGSWAHLALNAVWFLPFGAALARRFGSTRFLAFFLVTAAAGALVHLAVHSGSINPVIGASAAISGAMAAAMRFAFQRGGPLGFWRQTDDEAYRVPALPLTGVLRDPRVLVFLVVWFGINLLFGATSLPLTGDEAPVAWEAHIGGFLAGLLLFSLFDPTPRRTA